MKTGTFGNFCYDKIAKYHEKQIAKSKESRASGDVKGKIVIDQLKRYAKQLSDHTGDSACTEITVWHHPRHTGEKFSVDIAVFDSLKNKRTRPSPRTEDLRNLGSAIDEIIRRDK